MTTQVMFKIDPKLKKAAQKRAKKEGITLSDFYKSATKEFAAGKLSIGIIVPNQDNWKNYTRESFISYKKGISDLKSNKFHEVK